MPEQEKPAKAPEASSDTTSPYRTGTIIAARYRLLRQVGRGGMGEVWSAHHLTLNTEVAVKFLSRGAGGSAARLALERFRFEAQVSAHLGLKTAHVVAVHDAGSDAIGPYLVMEHVRGRTLRAELNRAGPLPLETVTRLLAQVTEALAVAHAFGIVHRDLKPSNLLLVDQPDGALHVKVADFGIAKALRMDLAVDRPEDTTDGWMLGSPAYMSPEQMSGGGVDARSDMWSLGVIVYECLVGRLPFPGRSVAELIMNMSLGRFEPPSNARPTLPPELDGWCLRALAKDREERFASVDEMMREFRRAIAGGRPGRRLPRFARGFTALVGLAAALLALRPAPSEALPAPPLAAHLPPLAFRAPADAPVPAPALEAPAPRSSPLPGAAELRSARAVATPTAAAPRPARAAATAVPAATAAPAKVLIEVF